ncbi:G-protein coupled receptor moody-like [Amphiura filiformis]|uniref:G-protein coupled receptor moody-like n=1 Tax=Amphiura filiformis TaxID=82378 RepID=UPI003B210BD2
MGDQLPSTEAWSVDNEITSSKLDNAVSLYSYTQRIVVGMICLLIFIFGSVGNSLVIIAVLLSRKLHTPPNVFVVSLATADLLTSVSLIWNVVALLGPNGWPLQNATWLCTVAGYIVLDCIGVSLLNLAAISLNRYILITKPYNKYRKVYSPVKIGLMVIFTWVIPSLLLLLLSLIRLIGFGYNNKLFLCNELEQHPQSELTLLLVKVLITLLVLVTVIISYILVYRHVRQHFKKKRRRELNSLNMQVSTSGATARPAARFERQGRGACSTADSTSQPVTSGHATRSRENAFNQMDLEVTKNLFIVVAIFFLCFIPYAIILFIPGSDSYHLYGVLLVFANSTFNPVIYARRHPHFKVVFIAMIKCRYKNIPEPTGIVKRFSSRRVNPNP